MLLIQQGKLKPDDLVSKHWPGFAANGKEKVTVEHLLLHTSGITYGFYGDSLVRKAIAAAKIYDGDPSTAEFAERIARLPLQEQPGTLWDYGNSYEVLGRVIEQLPESNEGHRFFSLNQRYEAARRARASLVAMSSPASSCTVLMPKSSGMRVNCWSTLFEAE